MKGDKTMTNGRWDVADKWINRILLLIGVIYFAWHVASKDDIKTLREELLKDNKQLREDYKQIREDSKQLREDMNRQFHELSARMDKSRNELQADIQRIEDDYKDHLAKHNE